MYHDGPTTFNIKSEGFTTVYNDLHSLVFGGTKIPATMMDAFGAAFQQNDEVADYAMTLGLFEHEIHEGFDVIRRNRGLEAVSNDPSWWLRINLNICISYWIVATGVVVVYDWVLTLYGACQILLVMQMFVLGPCLILSVREICAQLVTGSDPETSMVSIVFQEHVYGQIHITTGNDEVSAKHETQMADSFLA
ncbi:uncharacterized protein BJ212DRAFT_1297407 [Suillus subaureus]|uniref:Uncharacterized protein n=1 Tax=Suillus subaureus TaxID=48587 RepID=A0A9P7EG56_9AGAM|nr:uncharacterized protein BJ212DRAFT_1297407 [Suillus subaureus]KAG1820926.1 hypothetical protein BJ212DRAFT_1297407 [Suillus subaureus]